MTDTNQDPKYQDILTKYADSLKSTEVPKIPEPEAVSQASPETQLDSVPDVKPEPVPTAPPTILEPDPNAQDIPDMEPKTAVMMEMGDKPDETIPVEPSPVITSESFSGAETPTSDILETTNEVITPPPEIKPEAPKITQPDVQIPPSMMETPPVDTPPSAPVDDFVPPSPHPIEIAPDFVPPKANHFFKYLFFFSLVVFIVVVVLVGYSFINSQKILKNPEKIPPIVQPTKTSTVTCEINGEKFTLGQSFPATDGCNNCFCDTDSKITCTTMVCDATNTISPTESATVSGTPSIPATVSATKAPGVTKAPKATIVP